MKVSNLTSSNSKKIFDYNLEALRGIAALLVVWGHAIQYGKLLNTLQQPTGIWAYIAPGHISVLIFFVLSGYVIGLAHAAPLTKLTILSYLKKRVIRIYPIYFLCIILTLLLVGSKYSLLTVISHFSFTQVLLAPLIFEINPIWSLNYEVLFYLLFIPISFFRLNPVIVALLCVIVGCTNALTYPTYGIPLVSSYAFGFTFWLAGLSLAKYSTRNPATASYSSMMSMLFLILAIQKFNVLSTALDRFSRLLFNSDLSFSNKLPFEKVAIGFQDFSYLPYCLLVIAIFIRCTFKLSKYITFVLVIVPAGTFYSIYKHQVNLLTSPLLLPSLFYILAVLVYAFRNNLENISSIAIKRVIATGSISYGLYVIHFPILIIFSKLNYIPLFFGFLTRFILFLIISIILAYWLDKIYQPWIKKNIFKQ